MKRINLLCLLLVAVLLCCSTFGQRLEAPLDTLTLILFLRQEARDNEGCIAVDTSPRSTCIQGEIPDPPTA